MTPTRTSIPSGAKARRSRVAPVWVAVFVALGLLAVLGIRGLQRNRDSVLENARATSAAVAEQAARSAFVAISEQVAIARIVRLYPDLPRPGDATDAAASFEKALSLPTDHAEPVFVSIEQNHPGAVTPAGLPILPLIAWNRLERSAGDPGPLLENFAKRVVEETPSILSDKLLEQATKLLESRAVGSQPLKSWEQRWREDEEIRGALRVIPAGREGSQWIETPQFGSWWVGPIEGGSWRALSVDAMRQIATNAAKTATPILPPSAMLSARWAGKDLFPPSNGEILATRDLQIIDTTVILTNPEELFREQRQQTLWLSALLAVALLAVLSAFFALQKSLASERLLNQQKSDFVASVSHELRAPVSSMRLMLENLQNGATVAEPARAEYLKLMEGECRRLSALIENVLDFARIEHNRKSYEMAEADVKAMIEDVARLFEPRATQRRQRLLTELETLDPAPEIDALAVQQAVINLVDNAMKFSSEGTAITIRTKKRDRATWEISVTDEGPGIPAAERERIFERFYRLGSELRRETPGAGIGLAIVKHTVEAHGGHIEVESGSGTTFRLILPFVRQPAKT